MLIHTIRMTNTQKGDCAIYVHKLNPARSLNFGVDIYGTPVSGFIGMVGRIYEFDRDQPIVAVASLEPNPLFFLIDRLDSGLLHVTSANTIVFMADRIGNWPDIQEMEVEMKNGVLALQEMRISDILLKQADDFKKRMTKS